MPLFIIINSQVMPPGSRESFRNSLPQEDIESDDEENPQYLAVPQPPSSRIYTTYEDLYNMSYCSEDEIPYLYIARLCGGPYRRPEHNHPRSPGVDIFLDQDVLVESGKTVRVKTRTILRLPENTFGMVTNKLSNLRNGLHVANTVMDCESNPILELFIDNKNNVDVVIPAHFPIGQIVFVPLIVPIIEETRRIIPNVQRMPNCEPTKIKFVSADDKKE